MNENLSEQNTNNNYYEGNNDPIIPNDNPNNILNEDSAVNNDTTNEYTADVSKQSTPNPLYGNSYNTNNNYQNTNDNYSYNQPKQNTFNQGYNQNSYNPYAQQNYNYINQNPQQGPQNSYNPYNYQNGGAYNTQPPKKKNNGLSFALFALGGIICGLLIAITAINIFPKDGNKLKNNNDVSSNYSSSESKEPDNTYSNNNIDPDNSGVDIQSQPDISFSEYSVSSAFKKISPSVIGIQSFSDSKKTEDSITGEGTGVVATENGYIITNSHVVGDTKKVYLTVILSDGLEHNATVVGFDTKTDLAVIKIEDEVTLTPASFANSDNLVIGQDVAAVGNPGGIAYSNSVTNGIISALNRSVEKYSYVKYIQTNAAINPGNSGGPLVNLYGQVIGINTIKIADESYEGMGFAIPSNTVKSICDDLISKGYVSNRVRIGITGQELSASQAERYNVPQGILIKAFSDDSPFNGTEAKVDDIITEFNGVKITTFSQLYTELDKYKPGDKVKVKLYRSSSDVKYDKTIEVTISLVADEGQTQQAMDDE